MFTYQIDEELLLKLITPQDAERVFELTEQSRLYLREWLPWVDSTTTISDTDNYIKFSMKLYAENSGLATVIVYHGEIVGIAGFNQLNWSNRTAYIGYWLGQSYQGHGIMTRVAKGLTDFAFNEYNLNKVEIRVATENQKSRSIPERLGYLQEGTLRKAEWLYNHYVDHAIYGILENEWKNKKNNIL